MRSTAIEVLNQLEYAQDAVSTKQIGDYSLSENFEVLIKSGQIYNVKSEMTSFSYFKYSVYLLIGVAGFVVIFGFNNTLIRMLMKVTLEDKFKGKL